MAINKKEIIAFDLKNKADDKEDTKRIIEITVRHETGLGISIHVSPLKIEGRWSIYSGFSGIKSTTGEMVARFNQKKFNAYEPSKDLLKAMIEKVLISNSLELSNPEKYEEWLIEA